MESGILQMTCHLQREIVQLQSPSFDASRPVDLGLKDTKVKVKDSTMNCCSDDPQTLAGYPCEAMMTVTGSECLQPQQLSTNQFAPTAYMTYRLERTTSYSPSDHTLPVSDSVTTLCQAASASIATFTDSSSTTSVCILPATSSPHSWMGAVLPHTLMTASGSDQVPSVVDVLQCGSVASSRDLMTGPSCKSTSRRVCLAKINSSLVCFLCGGYLIDATTINRCLHSFCRACILRHLKLVNYCPVCKSLLGATHPHKSLRPDRTLQRVVYKVVPGLYRNERERRRRFSAVSRKSVISHRSHHQKVRPQSDNFAGSSWVYSDDESFSVCLRHQLHLNNASVYWSPFPVADDDDDGSNGSSSTNQLIGCRFVLCPALTSMQLIKKFIKLKLNLREQSKVFLFCSGEILPDDYTLLDIAYIFSWMKTGPLLIDYVILNTLLSGGDDACRLSSAAASAAAAAAALTEDVQPQPQRNLGYTSTQKSCMNTNQSCLAQVILSDPHLGLRCQDFNDNRSKQDLALTESNVGFSCFPDCVPPRGLLPSFPEVVQLQSPSFDASHPVDLGLKDTKAKVKDSTINCCSDDPQTLAGYPCEAMMTVTGSECLQPQQLSTNQFAPTAYHHHQQTSSSCYATEFGPAGLTILPETGPLPPHMNSSSCGGVGGMYSYGGAEDSSSLSTCGIQLIGILAQSVVDGSIVQLPDSCFLYNRPVISAWHPSLQDATETDEGWRTAAGSSNCFVERQNAGDGLQFLLPMMYPRTKTVADGVTDMTGTGGLPAYQYCSANAESLKSSFAGHNFQALTTKPIFNVDTRTEATQGEVLSDLDESHQQSWIGASQTLPSVAGDGKGSAGGDETGYCSRDRCNEFSRETDEGIAEQQCVARSDDGLLPQPLQLLHVDAQHGSMHHHRTLKMFDLSAGNVGEDNGVTDRRSVSVPTCHVSDDVLEDGSSCSLSVHGMSASEYHLLPLTGGHLTTQVTSAALLSVGQHSEMTTSCHPTLSSSNFPSTFRCPLPSFRGQGGTSASSSDHSIPACPLSAEQRHLQCNTESAARCHSYDTTVGWQTPPTEAQTSADETSQLSADDQRDERERDEALALSISVSSSSELRKPMLRDAAAAESERNGVERETRPAVDAQSLAMPPPPPPPPRLSFDSDSIIVDRSLELTTLS